MTTENSPLRENVARQLGSNFDVKKLLAAILAGWYWFVLALIITVGTAFAYLRYTTPSYLIRSTILLEDKGNVGNRVLSAIGSGGASDVNMFNSMYQFRSQDLIKEAVDSLQLNVRYYVEGRIKETELYNETPIRVMFDSLGYKGGPKRLEIRHVAEGLFEVEDKILKSKRRVPFGNWTPSEFGTYKIVYSESPVAIKAYLDNVAIKVDLEPVTAAVGRIQAGFVVFPADGRTSMLELQSTDNLPQRAVDFQNVILKLYRQSELEQAIASTQKTREFINENLQGLESKLQSTDIEVSAIKSANNMSDVGSSASAYAAAKTDAEREIEKIQLQKRILSLLRQSVNDGSGAIVGLAIEDGSISQLVSTYNQALNRMETFNNSDRTPEKQLERQDAQISLAAIRKRIIDAAEKVSASLDMSLQAAYNQASINNSRLSTVPLVERSIKNVQRNYETQNNLYVLLYQQRLQNEISANALTNSSKVVVAPYSSGVPTSPIPNTVYLIAIIIGLVVPGGIFSVRELLNNKVGNEQDISNITAMPIVGTISKAPDDADIVVGETIRTGIAEQFRLLRANLDFMRSSNTVNRKVIMVTSSISQEGKTFMSINLGLTLAIASQRVIILEFDLRKPKISERLEIPREGGISGYLAGLVGLDKVIKESGKHPNLFVANCGPIPPNPAELLLLPRTKKMMEELQELFDIILIDTAPIGMVSDAFILSQYSGVNLLVTRQGRTVKEHVRMLDATYRNGRLPNAAIIFNGVEHSKRYGYGYGYGNSYGYGYGDDGGGYYEEDPTKSKSRKLRIGKKK